jgi:hypothetical protein
MVHLYLSGLGLLLMSPHLLGVNERCYSDRRILLCLDFTCSSVFNEHKYFSST